MNAFVAVFFDLVLFAIDDHRSAPAANANHSSARPSHNSRRTTAGNDFAFRFNINSFERFQLAAFGQDRTVKTMHRSVGRPAHMPFIAVAPNVVADFIAFGKIRLAVKARSRLRHRPSRHHSHQKANHQNHSLQHKVPPRQKALPRSHTKKHEERNRQDLQD